ncbi:MAG: heavy metal-associated domain-containing protein [Chloroflexi bacterium]|nr:heavy metal-associated domain-containing protein [Chloroflexota bacterium]
MAFLKPLRFLRAPEARVVELQSDQATLEIDGLVCGICSSRVASALKGVAGVEDAQCDLETSTARVSLSRRVDADALASAVAGSVIAMPARRAIDRLARAMRF